MRLNPVIALIVLLLALPIPALAQSATPGGVAGPGQRGLRRAGRYRRPQALPGVPRRRAVPPSCWWPATARPAATGRTTCSTRMRRGRWCCPGWPSSPASVPTTARGPTPASARMTSSAAATPSPSPAPPRRWWPSCTRCCRRPRSPAPTSWRPLLGRLHRAALRQPPTPTRSSAWSSSTPTPSGWRP